MAAQSAGSNLAFSEKHHFWLRRLHSLAGVIPLGVFLVMHLLVNASVLGGEQMFDRNVARIHSLGPLVVPIEIVGIFIPLAFHILLGIKITLSASPNQAIYRYTANRRYTWQRITGVLAALFILYHLFHMHWVGKPLSFIGGARFDPDFPTETAASAMQAHPLIAIVYLAGVAATVYHFSNGLWTFLITWGITIGARSQRISGLVCAAIGVALGALGFGAVFGFETFNTGGAPTKIEQPHQAGSAAMDPSGAPAAEAAGS